MNTRRHFLKQVAVGFVTVAAGLDASAKSKPPDPVRFTKTVRAKTKSLKIAPGRWRWLVVHHSGTPFGNAASYDRQHRARGMENGLAYHFVIGNGIDSGDGQIEIGRRWLRQIKGGHVRSEVINAVGIGICLIGNFEKTRPTRKQVLAFRELVDYLRTRTGGKRLRFASHRELDPGHTACPGRLFPMETMHQLYGRFPSAV